ncbi:fimbrial protein [Burkholderia cepacia]|uniref:fimbrial protein n=1 Tax=Burkholderia cepacia TaxID=292 RepID=UPI001CE48969|nr:fimbrial protein [Burkholderia cepacia]
MISTMRQTVAKQAIRWIILGLMLILSQESFALACLNNATYSNQKITGEATQTSAINTTIAVSNTLPKSTVLWRSEDISLEITCWQDRNNYSENVYIYLSPTDPGYTQLGPDLELGVRMDGVDYYCANQMENFRGRCRTQLPGMTLPTCQNSTDGCPRDRKTKKLTISFLILKRSAPSTGKEGSLTGVAGTYGAFQFDGIGGMNDHPDSNFRMNVTGLNKLRYVACSSTLSVSPSTINFHNVAAESARSGKTIMEVPFSVTAKKSCDSVYGLGAQLIPLNATVQDSDTLVPNDNNSVGIRLLWEKNRSSIPFNTEFVLVPNGKDRVVVNDFLAQLKWNTSKPVIGAFNAGAAVEIYYK